MKLAITIVLVALCAGAGVLVLIASGRVEIEPRWNPWAPLRVADEPGIFTRYKLGRLAREPSACVDALRETPFRFRPLPDREPTPGCVLRNTVLLSATHARLEQPLTLSCPLAVAVALWERHSVQPAARRTFAQPVARLEHFGSYACRNLYGRRSAPKSRHATADALDVAGFVLADGRRVRVVDDWGHDDPSAIFLRDVHDGACQYFSSVLGPDYNAAHRDHFHLDRGMFGVCR
jgi:hypothetical protein